MLETIPPMKRVHRKKVVTEEVNGDDVSCQNRAGSGHFLWDPFNNIPAGLWEGHLHHKEITLPGHL